MKIQDEWLRYCRQLGEVISAQVVPYGKGVADMCSRLEAAINDYEFKIYLVGQFSCGKSTLLNNWLGVNLLPKAITPETAVATELHFSEDERTILYPFGEGDTLGVPVEMSGVGVEQMREATKLANQGKLACVRVYVNNQRLKEYSDLCLVDLPGLSSINKAHRLALDRFVLEKSVGIVCVPAPAGTVREDVLDFLQDMERFRADFHLLLTKCNECTRDDLPKICASIKDEIKNTLGIPEDELHVGMVFKEDVSAFGKMLDNLLKQRERIFIGRFRASVLSMCADMLTPLRMVLSKNFSDAKLSSAIASLEESEKKLPSIFNEISVHVGESLSGTVDRVMGKVKVALCEKAEGWISQMKAGGNCTADIGATIKRAIMYYMAEEVKDICDNWVKKAAHEFGRYIPFSIGEIRELSAEDLNGRFVSLKGIAEGATLGTTEGAGVGAALGAAIGGIFGNAPGAVLGAKIGGIIGGIVGLLSGGGAKIAENTRLHDELLEKLAMNVERCRPEVARLLDEAVENFNSRLKAAMDEKVAMYKEQLAGLKANVEKNAAEFAAKRESCRAAESVVQAIAEKVEMA